MVSSLGCIVKFKEILHTHIRLTKYDAITHAEVEPSQSEAIQFKTDAVGVTGGRY